MVAKNQKVKYAVVVAVAAGFAILCGVVDGEEKETGQEVGEVSRFNYE